MFTYKNGLNKEENAERLKKINRTQNKRQNKVNICQARENWNACDYINFSLQEYSKYGRECWEQTKKHNCCYCLEVNK